MPVEVSVDVLGGDCCTIRKRSKALPFCFRGVVLREVGRFGEYNRAHSKCKTLFNPSFFGRYWGVWMRRVWTELSSTSVFVPVCMTGR